MNAFHQKKTKTSSRFRIVRRVLKKAFHDLVGDFLNRVGWKLEDLYNNFGQFLLQGQLIRGFAFTLIGSFLFYQSQLSAQTISYSSKSLSEYESQKFYNSPPSLSLSTPPDPVSVEMVDIDSDGNMDLFAGVVNDSSEGVILHYEVSGDNFVEKSSTENIFGGETFGANLKVSFGDVDKDEDLDAIVYNDDETQEFIHYRNDNGSFTKVSNSSDSILLNENHRKNHHELVDIDNDGDADLVVFDYFYGLSEAPAFNVLLYQNLDGDIQSTTSADTLISDLQTKVDALGETYITPSFSDFDDDGDDDLVVTFQDTNFSNTHGIKYYINTGTTFNESTTLDFDSLDSDVETLSLAFGDLDGDDDLDLVQGVNGNNNFLKFWRNEEGTFSTVPTISPSGAEPVISKVDFDGDEKEDIIVSSLEDDGDKNLKFRFYKNIDGLYDFNESLTTLLNSTNVGIGSSDPFDYLTPSYGDIDNDGDIDIIVSFGALDGNDADQIEVYRNNNNASFTILTSLGNSLESSSTSSSGSISLITPTLEDIDGDGFAEFMFGNANGFVYFKNNSGAFTEVSSGSSDFPFDTSINTGVNARTSFYDLDNDGDRDLIIVKESGSTVVEIQENVDGKFTTIDLSKTLLAALDDFNLTNIYQFEVTDINEDCLPDVLYTRTNSNTLFLYESSSNKSVCENSSPVVQVGPSSTEEQSGEITFQWSNFSLLENPSYKLEISTSQSFDGSIDSYETTDTFITVTPFETVSGDSLNLAVPFGGFNPNQLIASENNYSSDLDKRQDIITYYLVLLLLPFILSLPLTAKVRRKFSALLLLLFLVFAGCAESDDDNSDGSSDGDSSDGTTTYYWRVTAKDSNNEITSATSSFNYRSDDD